VGAAPPQSYLTRPLTSSANPRAKIPDLRLHPSTTRIIMAVSTTARRRWDNDIPTVFRPLARAYLFGYASAAGPRLLTLLLQHVARRRRNNQTSTAGETPRDDSLLTSLGRILLAPLSCKSFPTACAVLIGGTTFLERNLVSSFP